MQIIAQIFAYDSRITLVKSLNTCDYGKSSESVQCEQLKACDACADMGQL